MGFYKNLTSLDGKRGCFTIILVATILTMFEIAFFYLVVVPNINYQFDNGIRQVSQTISNKVNLLKLKYIKDNNIYAYVFGILGNKLDNTSLRGVFHTLNERENKIITKNNRYVAFTGLVIIIILILILVNIKNKIYSDKDYVQKAPEEQKGVLSAPIWTAVFTVLILVSFQIRFYFFSLDYKFLGTGINNETMMNEMKYFIYDNI